MSGIIREIVQIYKRPGKEEETAVVACEVSRCLLEIGNDR